MKAAIWALLVAATACGADRTLLAIGAHAGDMEITAGAAIARQVRLGDRAVILHLTLGEGGNPKLSAEAYGEQKRREAREAAKELGAEALFAPYKDGSLPHTPEVVRYVADAILKVRPTWIVTHWKHSLHRDHSAAHAIVTDALQLAAVSGLRGFRGIFYAENWEDAEGFRPYLYLDAVEDAERWKRAATRYEFIRGGISSFRYLDYYEGLMRVRGAEAGKRRAVAFDVDPWSKKRVLDALP